MNDMTLTAALEPVVRGIADLALQDAAFQANLRLLLGSFMELLDHHITVEDHPMPNTEMLDISILDGNAVPEVGDTAAVEVPRATNFDFPTIEEIEARCRLKAKAAAWLVIRQQMILEGVSFRDDIAPEDQKLIAEAKQMGCFLWSNHQSYLPPANLSLISDLSRHYEILADAVSLVLCLIGGKHGRMLREALGLLAEVNRKLWDAVEMAGGPRDTDQQAVHQFLKTVTNERRIFVSEMRNESPLPELEELVERIHSLKTKVQDVTKRENKRRSHFIAAEYHSHLLASSRGSEIRLGTVGDQSIPDAKTIQRLALGG
jgi:hypothetical protein